jgi:hypothetical protein
MSHTLVYLQNRNLLPMVEFKYQWFPICMQYATYGFTHPQFLIYAHKKTLLPHQDIHIH